ncbi:MAG: class I SAM-dependent methyltransferase [Candidatus Curtissbacteria bacterium]|nr:class I SAM-dependent methyltransferase [Candidatus Curtissbacteria bacterium]
MVRNECGPDYYSVAERSPISIGSQRIAYNRSWSNIHGRHNDVRVGVQENQPVFVLGGFNHNSDTPAEFARFSDAIAGDIRSKRPKLVYLDMNREPLTVGLEGDPVEARLESLPFKDGSVDFMVLDRTVNFMDPKQVEGFSRSAAKVLSRNGLIFATFSQPTLFHIGEFLDSLHHKADVYKYNYDELCKLTGTYLKPVLFAEVDADYIKDYFTVVFSRRDSEYSRHQGQPYLFY